ncbi:unnamed protein product [Eruca vesicaria subsp. sativa]|uniref:Uncharacterized protein n=1 Tax=Eruca vesicaria subsp. sativa TaxID=29727 RepID=A0ABC8J7A6_ERUVS|nr:unnamed protein product [Eruca vesicaria subsp. sativa]
MVFDLGSRSDPKAEIISSVDRLIAEADIQCGSLCVSDESDIYGHHRGGLICYPSVLVKSNGRACQCRSSSVRHVRNRPTRNLQRQQCKTETPSFGHSSNEKTLVVDTVELSVMLCNDEFIYKLNKEWRGKDHHTHVLSMSQHVPELKLHVLMMDDIVISVETAARQAAERGQMRSAFLWDVTPTGV